MYPTLSRVTGLTGEATPKQIEYAEEMYRLLGNELPEERTKQAYSDYINANVKKYKEAMKKCQ